MRKKYLFEPNVKEKSFKVKNLAEVTDHAEGLVVGEELTTPNIRAYVWQNSKLIVLKMCDVNGREYVICDDGYLYEKIGAQYVQKYKCGYSKFIMGTVILNGIQETLHIDETGGRIVDKSEYAVNLPDGDYFATYSLRCFMAKDYTIYFSSPFDFNSRSMILDTCGHFNVNTQDGEVIGLYDFSSYLLIVCAKCFYKLTIIDEQFKLEKIKTDNYAIESMSLAKIREQLYFVSHRKFYVYEDFAVKEIPSVFAKHLLRLNCHATSDEDRYYCQANAPDRNCIFVYDAYKKTSILVYIGESRLVCKNLAFNYSESRFYIINPNSLATSIWKSSAMNLGNNDKKSLIELSIKVEKDATLKIDGDFGSKTFSLKAGINHKKMNLRSKDFTFEIYCPTINIVISDLQFKYL